MAYFPVRAGDISAEFLSEVLNKRVVSCECEAIGNGLVGDSARIHIRYAIGSDGPATIAGKFPAADPTSRSTGASMQLYEKEVGFYNHVAPHIATRTPVKYFAEHDLASGDFLLLMEDCGPALQGDQLASCTLEQARVAVRQLAGLHGPTFNQAELLSLPFLQPNVQVRNFAKMHYPAASEKFGSFYRGKIEDDLLDYITSLEHHSGALFGDAPHGPCVIHGDYRLDNMLFEVVDGAEPMATLDWQTIGLGDPLVDLGYFMGAGIGSALRVPNEDDLLEIYRSELVRCGGPDLGDIRSQQGYARGAIHGISTAVFSAAFVEHNDRSEAIFQSMAIGAAELARELGAMEILES